MGLLATDALTFPGRSCALLMGPVHLEGPGCGSTGFQNPGDGGFGPASDISLMCNLDRSHPSLGFLKPHFLPL